MIWVLLALGISPILLLIFIVGKEDKNDTGPVAHYQRQLAELDEDLKNNLLSREAAASARLEIERRILRLADHQEHEITGVRSGAFMPLFMVALILVTSLGLYLFLGKPYLPSKPGEVASLIRTPVTDGGLSYGETIEHLQQHLAANPEDQEQWNLLGQVARKAQAFSVAANAYGALVRLDPADSQWRLQQLDAYILMARGQITPAANLLLQALLEAEPSHPAGHYYMGLAQLQAGDKEAAKAIWNALADRSPPNAPWMPTLQRQLSELGVTPPKLSQEQINDVEKMSPKQQEAFVRSMIERLASRLESAPDDAEGWVMLARSQAALGEKDAAIATLTRALTLVESENRAPLQAFLDNLTESPNL